MQKVARAWNQGNAEAAVSRFTEDAIYSGPPSAGHGGRKSLYEIFWWRERARVSYAHGLAQPDLRPARQIGVGEYSFRYRMQTHRLVIVKVDRGLIRNWREYEVQSDLSWDRFVGDSRF